MPVFYDAIVLILHDLDDTAAIYRLALTARILNGPKSCWIYCQVHYALLKAFNLAVSIIAALPRLSLN